MSLPQRDDQRRHDLEAAYAGFKGVLQLLKSGYRFDDEEAPRALAQLENHLAILHEELQRLAREDGGDQ